MTVPYLDPGDVISDEWVDAVADQLNNIPPAIVSGGHAGSTDASGNITITFGDTFATTPAIQLTVLRNASGGHVAHLLGITTTTASVRVSVNGTALASTPVVVYWTAVGELA